MADDIADAINRAMIETNVAEQRLHFRRFDEAVELLASSLQRYGSLCALYPSSYAIDCAARLAARTGQPRAAATLVGAANHMRDIIGAPVEGSHGTRRAQLIEENRHQLANPAAYDEALAEGELMSFDDAIDAAIAAVASEVPPPRDELPF